MQVYLQHIKSEDSGDSEMNIQLDRLIELSEYYAKHWHELPSIPPYNIVPGTQLCRGLIFCMHIVLYFGEIRVSPKIRYFPLELCPKLRT